MRRRWLAVMTVLVGALLGLALLAPGGALAADQDPAARIACVAFNPDLGEYGAEVFRLLHKPGECLEYVGNKSCHCTEAPLTGIHWRTWGAAVARATALWHYCGSGVCTYRPAYLIAYRVRDRCGSAYTRLTMRLPRHRLHGHVLPTHRNVFHLPACGRPLEYI